ncbi:MAG: hypothetical protein E7369_02255 [Clostridiales bacterium]|nr:hypothetical protein [Clostridiales bacterium]
MIIAIGDLQNRIEKNTQRLKDKQYCIPEVFKNSLDWPGDWQGRAILALCSLYESQKDQAVLEQLNNILEDLPNNLNDGGYFGEYLANPFVNEQQLSGNSWFVRGLCAAYRLFKDEKIYGLLKKIKDNFFLKLEPHYVAYTVTKVGDGWVGGHVNDDVESGWKYSSDTGCAFILLDGLTDLCSIIKDERLLSLARVMAEKFLKIDYIKEKFQTHATLSASRGILRLYTLANEKKYLDAAIKNFDLYLNYGTTVNYANYNWFETPSSWTEPCAFIDSLMLAVELYKRVKDVKYLHFANRVYFNAIRSAQRKNGGAGCETCLCDTKDELSMFLYEASFCCTMRLSDGLNFIRNNAFIKEDDGGYLACFTTGGSVKENGLDFNYIFDAENSKIRINVTDGVLGKLTLCLPDGVRMNNSCNVSLQVLDGVDVVCISNLEKGQYIFDLEILTISKELKGKNVYFWADYLLTEKGYKDDSKIKFKIEDRVLSPFIDCMYVEENIGLDFYKQKI